ncbi:LPS-assembly protein [Sphingomonas sp. SORGH_AS802]|uniref:LPS-assembly protein LptD n=1 Tax=unclassified Sphingomonas TaxID=196159 RepID=UPI0028568A65|nr:MULTISPECIES: LPS assembly protein LptD [unclassified Sphingomonas]MDR6126479.1 LPS-assembly protein [Sphingomonas sp. SORGH_AS_0438]MDR6136309.1 LPS-assembly protein [Sphingomonas sp. SORGH_AS_0802]
MSRISLLAGCALGIVLALPASAQDLQTPVVPPPPPAAAPPADDDQVKFSANALEYDTNDDIVTATGDVRMFRTDGRLRADKVVWNRKTGRVVATGDVAIVGEEGDTAYGDSIDLTDSLKDGVVDNMLVVLNQGGRLAARRGTRATDGRIDLEQAAYTPCSVTNAEGCPKEPSWKITAVRVVYRPNRERVYYQGAQLHLFGLPSIPLPQFSHPVGGGSDSGLLSPNIQYSRVNGVEVALPYYFRLAPNRGLTLTPHVYSSVLPMADVEYQQLSEVGAFRLRGYATESRRSDDLNTIDPTDTRMAFRGYLDGVARYQFTPEWSLSGSLRVTTDRTFLRRYDISRDDRLRNTVSLQRIDTDSYFAVTGWAVQTLRVNDRQGLQPIALPEIDYRRRFDDGIAGGKVELQLNSLALTRTAGQDTQRAFASLRWDLRRLTNWGQELTFTAFARGDAYNAHDTLATTQIVYRGTEGFQTRAIGAVAVDMRWPFVGSIGAGTQRVTPRFQIVAAPRIKNFSIPNEDSRAVDLDDSNLFALNRFPGYDRFEDSSRATYGAEYGLNLPGFSLDAVVGQSYRLSARPSILPDGTGLSDRWSDIVGRTELRFRDFVSVVHRYRLDKDNFFVRRNEVDATIGSRSTYALIGYLKLNRDITTVEDLRDREEVRLAGRVQFARFWSAFGSAIVDLTDRNEDPLGVADGFSPIRHRLGIEYQDDCLRLGATWRRDYRQIGDARQGNNFLLTLAFTNLGR